MKHNTIRHNTLASARARVCVVVYCVLLYPPRLNGRNGLMEIEGKRGLTLGVVFHSMHRLVHFVA